MKSALTRYRVLAYSTGVFLILLTVHVIVQFAQSSSQDIPYSQALGLGKWLPGGDVWIPATHGYLYLIYVIVTADLWFRTRIPLLQTALVVIAGTVPFMSFVAERWVTQTVRPMLPQDSPGTAAETVRHPQ